MTITNKEFYQHLSTLAACGPARQYVDSLPKRGPAEKTWMECGNPAWVGWLAVRLRLWNDKTTWHVMQTTLEILGADLVAKLDINKPFASPEHREAYYLQWAFEDFGELSSAQQGALCDDIRHTVGWYEIEEVLRKRPLPLNPFR